MQALFELFHHLTTLPLSFAGVEHLHFLVASTADATTFDENFFVNLLNKVSTQANKNTGVLLKDGFNLLNILLTIMIIWRCLQLSLQQASLSEVIAEVCHLTLTWGIAAWFLHSPDDYKWITSHIVDGFDCIGQKLTNGANQTATACMESSTTSAGAKSFTSITNAEGIILHAVTDMWTHMRMIFLNSNVPLLLALLDALFTLVVVILLVYAGTYYFIVFASSQMLIFISLSLGPIFIPWLLIPFAKDYFSHWLKFTLVAGMYRVIGGLVAYFGGELLKWLNQEVGKTLAAADQQANLDKWELFWDVVKNDLAYVVVAMLLAWMMQQVPSWANGILSGTASMGVGPLKQLEKAVKQAKHAALSALKAVGTVAGAAGGAAGLAGLAKGAARQINFADQMVNHYAGQAANNLMDRFGQWYDQFRGGGQSAGGAGTGGPSGGPPSGEVPRLAGPGDPPGGPGGPSAGGPGGPGSGNTTDDGSGRWDDAGNERKAGSTGPQPITATADELKKANARVQQRVHADTHATKWANASQEVKDKLNDWSVRANVAKDKGDMAGIQQVMQEYNAWATANGHPLISDGATTPASDIAAQMHTDDRQSSGTGANAATTAGSNGPTAASDIAAQMHTDGRSPGEANAAPSANAAGNTGAATTSDMAAQMHRDGNKGASPGATSTTSDTAASMHNRQGTGGGATPNGNATGMQETVVPETSFDEAVVPEAPFNEAVVPETGINAQPGQQATGGQPGQGPQAASGTGAQPSGAQTAAPPGEEFRGGREFTTANMQQGEVIDGYQMFNQDEYAFNRLNRGESPLTFTYWPDGTPYSVEVKGHQGNFEKGYQSLNPYYKNFIDGIDFVTDSTAYEKQAKQRGYDPHTGKPVDHPVHRFDDPLNNPANGQRGKIGTRSFKNMRQGPEADGKPTWITTEGPVSFQRDQHGAMMNWWLTDHPEISTREAERLLRDPQATGSFKDAQKAVGAVRDKVSAILDKEQNTRHGPASAGRRTNNQTNNNGSGGPTTGH